jgi:hypothetical protein
MASLCQSVDAMALEYKGKMPLPRPHGQTSSPVPPEIGRSQVKHARVRLCHMARSVVLPGPPYKRKKAAINLAARFLCMLSSRRPAAFTPIS